MPAAPACTDQWARLRLVAHETAAGMRYQLERWYPSPLSRRGLWKPTGPLLTPREALQLTEGQLVDIVR